MKKGLKKFLIAVGITSLVLSGCGKKSNEANTSQKEEKVVKIVTGGDGLPYSLYDSDGKWTGIDAEMWAEISKRTGWTVEVEKTDFDSVFGQLDAGRADLAANCFAVKKERTDKYYASIPYYGDAQAIAVDEKNTDIKTFDDLKGRKVGITSGQASQTIIEKMAKEIGFEVVTYPQSDVGCRDLTLGRIDAMASAVTVFNNYMHGTDAKVRILDEKLTANNVAYFFPKNEKGAELKKEVDKVLKEMIDDGTVGKITKKWLFEDMTKLINDDEPAK